MDGRTGSGCVVRFAKFCISINIACTTGSDRRNSWPCSCFHKMVHFCKPYPSTFTSVALITGVITVKSGLHFLHIEILFTVNSTGDFAKNRDSRNEGSLGRPWEGDGGKGTRINQRWWY